MVPRKRMMINRVITKGANRDLIWAISGKGSKKMISKSKTKKSTLNKKKCSEKEIRAVLN